MKNSRLPTVADVASALHELLIALHAQHCLLLRELERPTTDAAGIYNGLRDIAKQVKNLEGRLHDIYARNGIAHPISPYITMTTLTALTSQIDDTRTKQSGPLAIIEKSRIKYLKDAIKEVNSYKQLQEQHHHPEVTASPPLILQLYALKETTKNQTKN